MADDPYRSWHAKLGQNDIASDSSMASEIANVLVATLSADPNTRIAAELRINELFRTPGSFFTFCHIVSIAFSCYFTFSMIMNMPSFDLPSPSSFATLDL
jgi:hypothetical protein